MLKYSALLAMTAVELSLGQGIPGRGSITPRPTMQYLEFGGLMHTLGYDWEAH